MKRLRVLAVFVIWVAAIVAGIQLSRHASKVDKQVDGRGNYYALGDSVAAGFGLETESDVSACGRTEEAYPNTVAKSLKLKLNNLACSGATINEGIIGKQDVNNAPVTPQLDQIFSKPSPSLISLTIGANDIGWTGLITKCFTGECGTDIDSTDAASKINDMSTNLKLALTKLQQHYSKSVPHLIVTGYFQVFPATGSANCSSLANIDQNEIDWWRTQQASLNGVIKNVVAGYTFAKYADVDFTNHELCSDDSWVRDLQSSGPFHPNDVGQQQIAVAVVSANAQFRK